LAAQPTDDVNLIRLASNKSRAVILRQLTLGPANLGSIANKTGLSRQLAAHHMNVLVTSGIVEQRAAGPVKLYALTERGSEIAQKVLGAAPQAQITVSKSSTRAADIIAPVAAVVVMVLATAKFLTTPCPLELALGRSDRFGCDFRHFANYQSTRQGRREVTNALDARERAGFCSSALQVFS